MRILVPTQGCRVSQSTKAPSGPQNLGAAAGIVEIKWVEKTMDRFFLLLSLLVEFPLDVATI